LAALSGICGSISIACWVVVFSPQIIENFRRSSAEGLSITFLVIWLAGDVFNILGAVLQGVIPTMLILAIYYTLADIVLIAQVFYYRGFTLSDKPSTTNGHVDNMDSEHRPLLQPDTRTAPHSRDEPSNPDDHRRSSAASDIRRHLSHVEHLSPATPIHDPPRDNAVALRNLKPRSALQAALLNIFAVLLVCAAGVFGWWLSTRAASHKHHHHHHDHAPEDEIPEPLEFDPWGQFFGYLCAVFYLGSRIPQIVLNYRRKSTEGVSLLFFLFACIGNLTYDMSIFAYDPTPMCSEGGAVGRCGPGEAGSIYARYLAVNASWIAGSLGTLLLDMGIFVQFFLYQKDEDESGGYEESVDDAVVDDTA